MSKALKGRERFFVRQFQDAWMGLDHPEIEGYNAIEQVLRGGKPDRMLRLVGKSLFDCFRGLR